MVTTLNFSAQVSDIIKRCEIRTDALIKQSVQEVIEDAQTDTGSGGRMRKDTGFLKASGQISLSGFPTGPERGSPNAAYQWSAENINVTLAGVKAGDTIWFGWTAAYAGPREFYDGFLSGAVQKWQLIVNKNAARLLE